MWILFGLLSSLLFSLVFVIDSYSVDEIFEKPWMGMIVSSMVSIIVFMPLPYILPLVSWRVPSWELVGLALLAGVIIQINQALYFEALNHSDAGIVAAYWNMVPTFLPVASFFIFRDLLTKEQYVGIAIILFCSLGICLLDANLKTRWNSFLLIAIASLFQIVAVLIMDYVFDALPFYLAFCLFTTGLILAGLFPLLFEDMRRLFLVTMKHLTMQWKLFFGVEILNLCAYGSFQMALKFGKPSLVEALLATAPAFAIGISLLFFPVLQKNLKKKILHSLRSKILLIGLMVVGIWLIGSKTIL